MGLDNQFRINELIQSGSTAITSLDSEGKHTFFVPEERGSKDGESAAYFEKPQYNEQELNKSVDTEVDELIDRNIPTPRADVVARVEYNRVLGLLEDANQQNETNRQTIRELQGQVTQLEGQVSSLQQQNDILEQRLQQLRETNQRTTEQLQSVIDDLNQTISDLQNNLASLQNSLNESIQQNSKLLQENASLQAQLASLGAQVQLLESEAEQSSDSGASGNVAQEGTDTTENDLFTVETQPTTEPTLPPLASRRILRTRARGNKIRDIVFENGEKLIIENKTEEPLEIRFDNDDRAEWIRNPGVFTLPPEGRKEVSLRVDNSQFNSKKKRSERNIEGSLLVKGRQGSKEEISTIVSLLRRIVK
jgi:predicted  nucleic acid-binding Zn-ribbon protein